MLRRHRHRRRGADQVPELVGWALLACLLVPVVLHASGWDWSRSLLAGGLLAGLAAACVAGLWLAGSARRPTARHTRRSDRGNTP